jgi:hypothetical protein
MEYPTRPAIWEYIYCFRRYSEHKIFYVNFFFSKIPWFLKWLSFDVVIFHNSLTGPWNEVRFNRNLEILKKTDFRQAIKVAFFQDEYFNTDMLCNFINALQVKYVFSVAPGSEWKKIYHSVDFSKVKFFHVLTGYIDKKILKKVQKIRKSIVKDIDVGYRTVWGNTYTLGKFGLLKIQIAEIFKNILKDTNVKFDISTHRKDIILGFNWYKFLLRCKYTIGVESGSSLLDRDGSIHKKIESFLESNNNALYEDIEKNCFSGQDGFLKLVAISPRHFEACITKTCQILIEGDYNGILKPGIHYIELKKDFSNINEIVELLKDENRRSTIVNRAYLDIVDSEEYTYEKFVNFVFNSIVHCKSNTITLKDILIFYLTEFLDFVNWIKALIFSKILMKIYNFLLRILGKKNVESFRKLLGS